MNDGPPEYVQQLHRERYIRDVQQQDQWTDRAIQLHVICPRNIQPDAYENYATDEAMAQMRARGIDPSMWDISCTMIFNVVTVLALRSPSYLSEP